METIEWYWIVIMVPAIAGTVLMLVLTGRMFWLLQSLRTAQMLFLCYVIGCWVIDPNTRFSESMQLVMVGATVMGYITLVTAVYTIRKRRRKARATA